ncbi:MAG TPA: response regulator [Rickettsiales bacterium]|nr:response regulator [Rickettsiales bacterium]
MHTKTIMIVEDMEFDRQMIASVVEKLGFHYIVCHSGDEAINLLKQQHDNIDLMLLDLFMPTMDGISILGHCKSRYPNLPVVMVSSTQSEDDLEQIRKWRANAFVSKPIDFQKLSDAIVTVLEDTEKKDASSG